MKIHNYIIIAPDGTRVDLWALDVVQAETWAAEYFVCSVADLITRYIVTRFVEKGTPFGNWTKIDKTHNTDVDRHAKVAR